MKHYILNRLGEPVRCNSLLEWGQWYATADRIVARTELPGVVVSTVFLGLDHRIGGEGPPILWESMVFAEGTSTCVEIDQEQLRYASREAALAGHRALVAQLQVN